LGVIYTYWACESQVCSSWGEEGRKEELKPDRQEESSLCCGWSAAEEKFCNTFPFQVKPKYPFSSRVQIQKMQYWRCVWRSFPSLAIKWVWVWKSLNFGPETNQRLSFQSRASNIQWAPNWAAELCIGRVHNGIGFMQAGCRILQHPESAL
jgi:hypothetical protein